MSARETHDIRFNSQLGKDIVRPIDVDTFGPAVQSGPLSGLADVKRAFGEKMASLIPLWSKIHWIFAVINP